MERRDFILSCCQAASAGFISRGLRGFPSTVSAQSDVFHLRPHYSVQRPVESMLLKRKAGFDDFIEEKYCDEIAGILGKWSSDLLRSPTGIDAIGTVLGAGFLGSLLRATESRSVRSGPALEILRITFAQGNLVGSDAFLSELRKEVDSFSKILNADFQITRIKMNSGLLQTQVFYELAGTGTNFYREQRNGFWDLEWETASTGEYQLRSWRAEGETRSRSAKPWFADITEHALGGNRSYPGQIKRGVDYWRTVLDGACGIDIYGHNGVSVGDIDEDGFDDLYICQPAGLPNRLFRNRGDGTFEDITEMAGVGILENTACALFADFDNDGLQDLIVVRSNGPLLFVNQGKGKFRLKKDAFQFASVPQGAFTGAAAADYDRDGRLDIYFCLYVYYQGTDQYKYPTPYYAAENGPPNFLMRNNGDGNFRDVTRECGLDQNNNRFSFCCGWGDYNQDGWPDLYVANDFGRKNLYRNNGDGTFTDVAAEAGAEDTGAGMSVCWFDYDDDGTNDLYVGNMWTAAGERISTQDSFKKESPKGILAAYRKHAAGNSMLRNSGQAFRDVTAAAQVGMGRWSWSSDAWDFDHDGFEDIYIANGMVSGALREDLNSFFWRQVVANSPDQPKSCSEYEQGWNAINELIRSDYSWSGFERNVLYANNQDGTFSDVSMALGLDFIEDGRAFALADFDHDGRQELLLKNRNAPGLRLLKNVAEELPPAIAFRLRGTKSNRDAIGAAVTVSTQAGHQTRLLQAGSGFLSQHSKELFFGLGQARGPLSASIRWPSGLVQEMHGIPPNHRVWMVEGEDTPRLEPFRISAAREHSPIFSEKEAERLPDRVESWLLAPIAAPDFVLPDLTGIRWHLAELRGKAVLLNFWTAQSADCLEELTLLNGMHVGETSENLQLLTVNFDQGTAAERLHAAARQRNISLPILFGTDETAGVYNILYRYIFERHRDLSLPTSFLLNANGEVVKIYQGRLNPETVREDFRRIPQSSEERLARALPFPGVAGTFEFGRNHLSFGSVYFQSGYLDQAEASFLRALGDDVLSAEAHYGLGSVYLKQEKLDKARRSFEEAVKGNASYPDTLPNSWNNLGLITAREGRIEEAIGYFQQALRVSPDYAIALQNLGNAYRQVRQWSKAQEALERAVALRPDDPEPKYSLGMVFAQTNDTDRAYEYLQKALKLRPAYPEALNNLGVLYVRMGRLDEAVTTLSQCIRSVPTFDQAYLNLAKVYALQKETGKARTVLMELLKQQPNHSQAQKALDELR